MRDSYALFNNAVSMSYTRVAKLVSELKKKSLTDQVVEQSMDLYGYTPDQKSDENEKWMLQNGYIKSKKTKRVNHRRRR